MADVLSVSPVVLNTPDLPLEQFQDTAFGTVTWRTLFTSERTRTAGLTCGVAYLDLGDSLNLHSHTQAEIYFGLSGTARVMVDGQPYDLVPGTAVYIPGGATHGAFADDTSASFFYTFPTCSFSDVLYVASPASHETPFPAKS